MVSRSMSASVNSPSHAIQSCTVVDARPTAPAGSEIDEARPSWTPPVVATTSSAEFSNQGRTSAPEISSPEERTAARSQMFWSSRTLPGQA